MDDTPQIKNAYQQYLAYANELPVSKIKTELVTLNDNLEKVQYKLNIAQSHTPKYGPKGTNMPNYFELSEKLTDLKESIKTGISKIIKAMN